VTASMSDLASLMATGLRGLRARPLLTVGSVLLATIAVAAAVVGPMYQSASAASYVVTRLRAEPDWVTGLTLDYTPETRVNSAQAEAQALDAVDQSAVTQFRAPEPSLWARRLPVTSWSTPGPPLASLLAGPGICSRLVVTGRCPVRAGEMLMLESDAAYTHTDPGDRVRVDGVSRALRVVGTYRLPTTGAGWFNTARFTSVPSQPTGNGYSPYFAAPFVVVPTTVTGMDPGQWFVRMDYRLRVLPDTTLDDLRQAATEVSELRALLAAGKVGGASSLESGNALASVVAEAQARSHTAEQTVTPAVVSLILVALVLLGRLLSAAMGLRMPELALASLRGMDRRQQWVLGISEPVLMLVVAWPIGMALGYLGGRVLAAAWLVPDLPVELGMASVWFGIGIIAASLMVAGLTVRAATAEPLSVQISSVRRPARSGRWVVLLRLTLVAAAVTVLGATLWSSHRSAPTTADLLLPVLLAIAAGLMTTQAAATAARWWADRSAHRRGVAGYVASRTIARRREGTLVVLPLTAALAIAVFAAGIYEAAANWRASDAATQVGADTAFEVRLPLSQAVSLTHRLDPNGQWLMAVGANSDTNGSKVIVDAPRLPRVAVWPSSWTAGRSVEQVARELSPVRPTLTLIGRRIQITAGNQISGDHARILVSVDIRAPSGRATHIYLGPYPHGQTTASAAMPCQSGCEVTGLTLSAPTTVGETMQGTVTIGQVRVDGEPMPYLTRIGWRAVVNRTFIYGAPSVEGTRVAGSTLTVRLDSHGRQVVAMLTPRDVPRVLPVLMGRTAQPEVVASHGDNLTVATSVGVNTHVRSIGTTESMPMLGPAAMLVDDTMYTRANVIIDADTKVSILARSDTPPNIFTQLAAHGITGRTTLQQVRHTLDQDPYALALNLYLVVTVIVILLALAGLAANMAIQIPARRRDAASLRVVGLTRRSIVTAAASEFTVVLGAAAVAGILAGALSQYVVVRTVTLGFADSVLTPRVLPSLNLTAVAVLLGVAFAILLCLAVLLGGLAIRGARTATLREDL
jgi:putative ABC transport system permease protein